MNINIKNLFHLHLLVFWLGLLLPADVLAQFSFTANSDGSLNISEYTGSGGAVVIPSSTNGLPITSIGSEAFLYCTSLTSITIGKNIVSIGDLGFYGCTNLTSIKIDTNVVNIGVSAFSSCSSLTNVSIPASVTSIGNIPFSNCSSLMAIMVDGLNPYYSSVAGVLFNKNQNMLITYPEAKTGGCYIVPSSVTSVESYAFSECTSLKGVYFQSNALPGNDGTVFNGVNATAYYLVGTTGWGPSFDGLPTEIQYNINTNCPNITVSPVIVPIGIGGATYNQTYAASGGAGPYIFAVGSGNLPTGLTLSPNGLLLGTNTYAPTTNYFIVTATDTNGCTGSQNVELFVCNTNTEVVAWGGDYLFPTAVPSRLTNVVAISTSQSLNHSLALLENGAVVGWGDDTYGECDSPNLTNAVAIAAGQEFSLALKGDGTVVAWGNNAFGQTNVPFGLSNVVAIAVDGMASFAIKGDGTVVAWGDNTFGITNIPMGLTNVVAIVPEGNFSLALKGNGTVVAWGNNNSGQTNVPPGLTNIVSIAAVLNCGLAIKNDRTIIAWGNTNGIPTNLTNVVEIESRIALLGNESVVGWNPGDEVNIPQGLTNVVAIAASYGNLALVRDGNPVVLGPVSQFAYSGAPVEMIANAVGAPPLSYQWQFNGTNIGSATTTPWFILPNAQLANAGNYNVVVSNSYGVVTGSTAGLIVSNSPPIFLSQPANIAVPLGDNPSISVTATGSRPLNYQWQFNGVNISGATNAVLGLSNVQQANGGYYSVVVSNPYGTNVSSSASLSFVLTSVVAWGLNSYAGTFTGQASVPLDLTNVVTVAAGAFFSLALNADGSIVCWGDDSCGQCDVPEDSIYNVEVIAAGYCHALALNGDGTVVAWGYNGSGQTNVPLGLTNVVAMAAGYFHSLALKGDGTVVAWGDDQFGECDVPADLTNAVAITAGYDFSFALKADQTIVAWGNNDSVDTLITNIPADLTNVIAIRSGPTAEGCLALKADGTAEYWGSGATGSGNIQVPDGLSNLVAVSVSQLFGMGLKADHTVNTWGDNTYGELDVPSGLTNVIAIATGYGHTVVLDPNGGVITISVGFGGSGKKAYLIAPIGPPEALAAGGCWRATGMTNWSTDTNYAATFNQGQIATIIFNQIPGWNMPPAQNLILTPGSNTVVSATYTPIPPLLLADPIKGLGLTGTSGTTYRLEYSTNLVAGQWLPLTTNTLGAGNSTIMPWPQTNGPTAFYRAVWLP